MPMFAHCWKDVGILQHAYICMLSHHLDYDWHVIQVGTFMIDEELVYAKKFAAEVCYHLNIILRPEVYLILFKSG